MVVAPMIVAACLAQGAGQQPAPGSAPAGPEALIEQSRLMALLKELPAKRSPAVDAEHIAGLERTEELLRGKLKELGVLATEQTLHWPPKGKGKPDEGRAATHEWHNFIVDFPGTDLSREVVLVGAHFDAVPNSPGIDDNGTGVAGLLEAARAIKAMHDQGATTRRTIRLVFFNLEEVGLIGSANYVHAWREANPRKQEAQDNSPAQGAPNNTAHPGTNAARGKIARAEAETITAMISLEMLGFYSDVPGSQHNPFKPIPGVFEPPTVGDNIVLVALARDKDLARRVAGAMTRAGDGLKVFVVDFSPVPLPDLMRSDHGPFALAGLPGMMLTDTANFRNPNYHRPTDTIETIDAARFTKTVKGVAGAVWEMAEGKEKQQSGK